MKGCVKSINVVVGEKKSLSARRAGEKFWDTVSLAVEEARTTLFVDVVMTVV